MISRGFRLTGIRRALLSGLHFPGRGMVADKLKRAVALSRSLSPEKAGWDSFNSSFARALRLLEAAGALEVQREDTSSSAPARRGFASRKKARALARSSSPRTSTASAPSRPRAPGAHGARGPLCPGERHRAREDRGAPPGRARAARGFGRRDVARGASAPIKIGAGEFPCRTILVSRSGLGVLALLLVTTVTTTVRADDEKIFHFKNGRSVAAEILEETPTSYVVKTAGGGFGLRQGHDRVDRGPARRFGNTLLGGPAEAGPKPGVKPTAAPGVAAPPAAPAAPAPLASEGEVASAKRALAAVPPANPDDPPGRHVARPGPRGGLRGLPPSRPSSRSAPRPRRPLPQERLIAAELVIAAGDRARPFLARAIRATDASKDL